MTAPEGEPLLLSATEWRKRWAATGSYMADPRQDAEWACPCATMLVACEECGNLCNSVCLCEEAFCSLACQKSAWKEHKKVCLEVRENNLLGQMLHQLSYALDAKVKADEH